MIFFIEISQKFHTSSNDSTIRSCCFEEEEYFVVYWVEVTPTSRERHKSAPYLRLKNSKRMSKCQVFSSTVPEKPKSWCELALKVRTPPDFLTSIVAKHQKTEGGLLRKKRLSKKSLTMPTKAERGDPLVLPGTVCYAEKQEKSFWFNWLGQMVQFDTIKFRITFLKLFWSVRVDWKKVSLNSRVSLHETPNKNI